MMNEPRDYRKFAVLYVDDEEKSLKAFTRAYGGEFRVLTASTAQAGLELLERHQDEIGLLMTDQRMPGEKGVWLLEHARQLRPGILRILVTAYSDLEAVIAAVNSGQIYKYISKPWDPPQLEMMLKRALEFFIVQRERDQLMTERMAVLHHAMAADRVLSLGLLAAGMSHHIRNSLVAVKTFLDLAPVKLQEENLDMDRLRNPDFWKDYHQEAERQIEKITGLLKDLWLASEKPPFQFADRVNLADVVASVVGGLESRLRAAKLQVEIQIPPDQPSPLGDRPKIVRLFELLLTDEIVSLPPGSRIRISSRTLPESSEQRQQVEVEMEDDGPGLAAEELRLLFDPFVVRTDSPREYGINLMACFFIAHHHGGRIAARLREPHGTLFTLRLPMNPNQPPPAVESQEFLSRVMDNESLWNKMISSDKT
jgi:two-component system probable response regulator PhcQ